MLYNFDPHGFELPYTKTLIASRLRIEKETFSRTLQTLREQGITVAGTHVSIKDMRKADNFACGECSVADECGTHRALHEKLDKQIRHSGHKFNSGRIYFQHINSGDLRAGGGGVPAG